MFGGSLERTYSSRRIKTIEGNNNSQMIMNNRDFSVRLYHYSSESESSFATNQSSSGYSSLISFKYKGSGLKSRLTLVLIGGFE